MDRRLVRC